jgi:hypothetical protein
MKGLRDLGPLVTAPALEQLVLADMDHLQVEDIRCLVGLVNVREVTPGIGSIRKFDAAEAMLGLPLVEGDTPDWREV